MLTVSVDYSFSVSTARRARRFHFISSFGTRFLHFHRFEAYHFSNGRRVNFLQRTTHSFHTRFGRSDFDIVAQRLTWTTHGRRNFADGQTIGLFHISGSQHEPIGAFHRRLTSSVTITFFNGRIIGIKYGSGTGVERLLRLFGQDNFRHFRHTRVYHRAYYNNLTSFASTGYVRRTDGNNFFHFFRHIGRILYQF